MKYSPSYLAFTPDNKTIVLTIEGEGVSNLLLSSAKIVSVTPLDEKLSEKECKNISVTSFSKLTENSGKIIIELSMTKEISENLKNCITNKSQRLALQIDIPSPLSNDKVTTQQRVLLPIFDNSQGNLLTQVRTQSVLGELTANLIIKELSCDQTIIYTRKDITCLAEITNATNFSVLTNLVTTVREGLPPGLTLSENIERTNILISPGESYNLNFTIPKDIYKALNNKVSVISSFTSIGTVGADFVVSKEQTIWFLPPLITMSFCVGIFMISVILFRKKLIKFITTSYVAKKAIP